MAEIATSFVQVSTDPKKRLRLRVSDPGLSQKWSGCHQKNSTRI